MPRLQVVSTRTIPGPCYSTPRIRITTYFQYLFYSEPPTLALVVASEQQRYTCVPSAMPSASLYPTVDIPDVDLWTFLFERKEKPFPDDHGRSKTLR